MIALTIARFTLQEAVGRRLILAGLALSLAVAISTFAGTIHSPGVADPPPPPASASTSTTSITTTVILTIITLIR